MILISHRGNTNGIFEFWENEPTYIDMAIKKGYDVEVDVWFKDNILFFGHDKPEYSTNLRWLRDRISKLWLHCKNVEALQYLKSTGYDFNYFWHESDTLTLTSRGYMWANPREVGIEGSIAVLPELKNTDVTKCLGICSDVIENYKL